MERRRELLLGFLTIVITVAICLSMAEVALRFLPVASGFRTVAVTAESPIFHFTPNRDFVFSRDWDMTLANSGHVNNAGYVNDQDYHKDNKPPLVAIVGDSMIEAAMVPYRDTLQGRLAKALDDKLRVYSFAASGAPLSQYLIWARQAAKDYGAQSLIINVVGNDFDESHADYRTSPGFWQYAPDGQGQLNLRLFEYRPAVMSHVIYGSALMRYLVFNLHVGVYWIELRNFIFGGPAMAAPQYAGHTAADANPIRMRDSLAVVDAFFHDLPNYTGLPPSRIVFVLEGLRYPDVAAASIGTYFDRMRKAFQHKAETLGYDVIDLDPYFFEHFRRTGERFEFARDGHWSAIGHGVAFEAVMGSRLLARLLSSSKY